MDSQNGLIEGFNTIKKGIDDSIFVFLFSLKNLLIFRLGTVLVEFLGFGYNIMNINYLKSIRN